MAKTLERAEGAALVTDGLEPTPPIPSAAPPMRADARRNYERLLAVAKEVFAERGADASLDEIARRAGVGVGTLYRHFPTRQALLEDVVEEQLEKLANRAQVMREGPDPVAALKSWLEAMMAHSTTYRGLASALMIPLLEKGPKGNDACRMIHGAGDDLLDRAKAEGLIRPEVTIADLLKLTNGIALAVESSGNCQEQAQRLLGMVIDGVRA